MSDTTTNINWDEFNANGNWHRPPSHHHHHHHNNTNHTHNNQPQNNTPAPQNNNNNVPIHNNHDHMNNIVEQEEDNFNYDGAVLRKNTAFENRSEGEDMYKTKNQNNFTGFNNSDDEFANIINTQRAAFNPECVGAINWSYIFTRAMRYAEVPTAPTEEEKLDAEYWLNDFFTTMGCEKKCTKHVMEYSEQNPVKLNSRAELVTWLWELKNDVNRRLGKPFFTKKQFIKEYLTDLPNGRRGNSFGGLVDNSNAQMIIAFIIFALIIGMIFLIVKWFWFRKAAHETMPRSTASNVLGTST